MNASPPPNRTVSTTSSTAWRRPLAVLGIWALTLMVMASPAMAADQHFYAAHDAPVDGSGVDTNDCTTPATPCTIQGAINAAGAGDTVHVAEGQYDWAGTIQIAGAAKNGLTLIGDNSPFAAGSAPADVLPAADASELLPATTSGLRTGMIWVRGAQDVTIENLLLQVDHGRSNEGIVTTGNANGLVLRNNFLQINEGSNGKRNAISLNMHATGTSESDKNSTGEGPGPNMWVTLEGNVVFPIRNPGNAQNAISTRAVVGDNVAGVFRNNQLAGYSQDIRLRNMGTTARGNGIEFEGNYIFGAGFWLMTPNDKTSQIVIRDNHFIAPGTPGWADLPLGASALADPDFSSLKLVGSTNPVLVEGNEFAGYARFYRGLWIQNWSNVTIKGNDFTPNPSYDGISSAILVGNKEVWNGAPVPHLLAVTILGNTFNAGYANANSRAIVFINDNNVGATAGTLQVGDGTYAGANHFAAGLKWYIGLDEHTCNYGSGLLSKGLNCTDTNIFLGPSGATPKNSPLGEGINYVNGSNGNTQGRPFPFNVTAIGNDFAGKHVDQMTFAEFTAVAGKMFDQNYGNRTALGLIDYGTGPRDTTGTIVFDPILPTTVPPTGSAYSVTATLVEEPSATCVVSFDPTDPTAVGIYDVTADCSGVTHHVTATSTLTIEALAGTVALEDVEFDYDGTDHALQPKLLEEPGASCTATPASVRDAGTHSVSVSCQGNTYSGSGSISVTVNKAAGTLTWGALAFDYSGTTTYTVTATIAEDGSACTVSGNPIGPEVGTYTVTATSCNSPNYEVAGLPASATASIGGAQVVHRTRDDAYFPSIQVAIDDAGTVAGDTLEVAPGTYSGGIVISKGIHLIGSEGYTPLAAGPTLPTMVTLDGGNAMQDGIVINTGVIGASISRFEIRNYTRHCIHGNPSSGGFAQVTIEQNLLHGCGNSGIWINGDASQITIDHNEVHDFGNRGIVVWNGFKDDITISNNYVHDGAGCCGIELQDGTAAGAWILDNVVENVGDSGMGFVQLTSGSTSSRANVISGNQISNTGRFGIEVKIPNGTGADSGDGAIVVENNLIDGGGALALRDRAGIAVIRNAYSTLTGVVDVTRGVIVRDNNVSGFQTSLAGYEGYGLVVEGLDMSVERNQLDDNDIGFQIQAENPDDPAPAAPDQNAQSDWFNRGNAPFTCVTVGDGADANGYSGNLGADQREIPASGAMIGAYATNDNTGTRYCSITSAVAAASDGDTITVDAGTFAENVVVTRPITIQGAGQAQTTIVPAVFNPDCSLAGGSGTMCDANSASVVFLVKASDVEISDLTVDGVNPDLHPTDIAARNGIITNIDSNTYNNLYVHDTTVRNIFLRAIYASSGGTFHIADNRIENVTSDPSSIAFFNWAGSGIVEGNTLDNVNDGIVANHSRGTIVRNNVITGASSAIHTDNSNDGGGTSDEIHDNTVSCQRDDSWGIWVFVQYADVSVHDNQVDSCALGLVARGGQQSGSGSPRVIFTDNHVDASGATTTGGAKIGAYLTPDSLGYGAFDNFVDLTGNRITGFDYGVVTVRAGGKALTTDAHFNRLSGNGYGWVDSGDPATGSNGASDFENNWWGCNDSPDTGAGCAAAAGDGDFDPWLVLSLPAGPIEIARNATVPIAADLNHNSDGDSVTSVFPDGTSIAFAADNGASVTTPHATAGGVATTSFSGLASGQSTVSATLESATAEVIVRITQATITLDPPLTRTYDTTAQAVTATIAAPHAAATYEVEYEGTGGTTYGPTDQPPTDAGTYTVTATITDSCCEGSASGTLTIQRAATTIDFDQLVFTYDGSSLPVIARLHDESGTTCTVTESPIGPNVGSYPVNAPACTGTNYEAPAASAQASVTPQPTTISFSHLVQEYDGSPKSVVATTAPTPGVPLSITYDGSPTPPTAIGTYPVVATITDGNHVLDGGNTASLQIIQGTGDIALVLNGPVDPVHVGDYAHYAATMLANPALHVGETFGYDVVLSKTGGSALDISDIATMEVAYDIDNDGTLDWVSPTMLGLDLADFFDQDPITGDLVYQFPDGLPGYSAGFPILDASWTWNFRFTFATTGVYTTSAQLVDGATKAPIDPTVIASIATVVTDALPATDLHLVLSGPSGSVETQQVVEYAATLLADHTLHAGERFNIALSLSKAGGASLADLAEVQVFDGFAWHVYPPSVVFTEVSGALVYVFPDAAGFPVVQDNTQAHFRVVYANTGVYTLTGRLIDNADYADPDAAHVYSTGAVSTTVVDATPHLPNLALLLSGPLDDVELGDPAQYTGLLLAEPAQYSGQEFWVRIRISKTGGSHALTATDLAKMELFQGGWQDHTALLQPLLQADGGDLVYYFPQPFAAFTIDNAIFAWNFRFTYGDTGEYTATADLIDAAEANPLVALSLANASVTTTVIDTPQIQLQLQGAITGMVGTPVQYVGTLTASPLPDASELFHVQVRIQRDGAAATPSDISKAEIFWGGQWVDPEEYTGQPIPWTVDPVTDELVYLFPEPLMAGFPIDEPSWSWQFRFTYANAGLYTATATVVTADGSATPVSNTASIFTSVEPLAEDIRITLNGPVAGVEVESPTAYLGRLQNLGGDLPENGYVQVRIEMAGETLAAGDVTLEVWDGSDWVEGFPIQFNDGLEVDFPDGAGFPIEAGFDYTHQFRITYHRTGVFHAMATVVGAASGDAYASAEMFTEVVAQAIRTATIEFDPASLQAVYNGASHAALATTDPTGLTLVYTYDGLATEPTDAGSYVVQATVNDTLYQGSATAVLTIDKAPATVTINPADLAQRAGSTHTVGVTTNPVGLVVGVTYDGGAGVPTLPGVYTVVATVTNPNYVGSASASLVVGNASDIELQLQGAITGMVGTPVQYVGTLTANPLPDASELFYVEVRIQRDGVAADPSDIEKAEIYWGAWVDPEEYTGQPIPWTVDPVTNELVYLFPEPLMAGFPIDTPSWSWQFRFTYANAGLYTATATVVTADGSATPVSNTASIFTSVEPLAEDIRITLNGPVAGVEVESPTAYLGRLQNLGGDLTENGYVKVRIEMAGQTLLATDVTLEVWDGSGWVTGPANEVADGLEVDFPDALGFPIGAGFDWTHQFRITYHRTGLFQATATVVGATSGDTYATAQMFTDVVAQSILTATVEFDPLTLHAVYDGSQHAAVATTTPGGLTLAYTYDGTATEPTDAGSYVVQATVVDPLYTGSATAVLTIDKATGTVDFDTLTGVFGAAHAVTATIHESGEACLPVTGVPTQSAPVGSYTISASCNGANHVASATALYTVTGSSASIEAVLAAPVGVVTLDPQPTADAKKSYFDWRTNGSAGEFVRAFFKVSSNNPAAAAGDLVVEYLDTSDSTWKNLPMSFAGGEWSGWFGPGSGFPLVDNAVSSFRASFQRGGRYVTTASLVGVGSGLTLATGASVATDVAHLSLSGLANEAGRVGEPVESAMTLTNTGSAALSSGLPNPGNPIAAQPAPNDENVRGRFFIAWDGGALVPAMGASCGSAACASPDVHVEFYDEAISDYRAIYNLRAELDAFSNPTGRLYGHFGALSNHGVPVPVSYTGTYLFRTTAKRHLGNYTVTPQVVGISTGTVYAQAADQTIGIDTGLAASIEIVSGDAGAAVVGGNAYDAGDLTVRVRDMAGNPVSGASVAFNVIAGANGAGASLSSPVATDANGETRISASSNDHAGAFEVSAKLSNGVELAVPFGLLNTADHDAAQVQIAIVSGDGQTAQVGNDYGLPLEARVTDRFGNPLEGINVDFAALDPGAGISPNLISVTSGPGGLASSGTLTANATAGAFTVTAMVDGSQCDAAPPNVAVCAVGFDLTNTAGGAASVTLASSASDAVVGTVGAYELTATVRDINGNPVEGVSVTLVGPSAGAGIAPALATGITNAAGEVIHTFDANITAGAFQVQAVVSGTSPASVNLENLPGDAASIELVSGNNQAVPVNSAFADLVVRVVDQYGNAVADDEAAIVSFVAQPAGNGASANDVVSATSGGDGLAATPASANGTAGSYSVVASFASTSLSFSLENTVGGVSITDVVWSDSLDVTTSYTGTAKTATATVSGGHTATFTYNGSATAPTNAGSYLVIATVDDGNVSGTAQAMLTIAPAADGSHDLTLAGGTFTYNGVAHPATVHNPLGVAYTLSYAPGGANPPVNAGSYGVTLTVTDPNYAAEMLTATIVITPAEVTLAFGNLSHVYDGGLKSATVMATPAVAGLALSYSQGGLPATPINAGSYGVEATLANPNYTLMGTTTATLTISQATAQIFLSDLSHVYNGGAKAATVTVVPASLAGSITVAYTPDDPPVNAGNYTVTASLLGNANYADVSVSDTLTIARATGSVNFAPLSGVYGTAHAVTATLDPAGDANESCTVSGVPAQSAAVGSYQVIGACTSDNHVATGSATYTVTPVPALDTGITLAGGSFTYNGAAHPAVVTNPNGVAYTLTYVPGGSTAPVNVGSYDVTLTVTDPNYEAQVLNAQIEIIKANVTLAFGNLGHVYDGTAKSASVTTDPLGVTGVSLSYSQGGSAVTPIDAGSYDVAASLTNPNYQLTGTTTATLTIGKAPAQIFLSDLNHVYDGTTKAASVTTVPASLAGDVVVTYTPANPVDVGSYAVVASLAGQANYADTQTAGTLTIVAASIAGFEIVGNDSFTGAAGAALSAPLPTVRVFDTSNNGVPGISISFAVTAGGGSILGNAGATVTTDGDGEATVPEWVLGAVAGGNTMTASTGLPGLPTLVFTAVGEQVAQLTIEKTADVTQAHAGEVITWTLVVGNDGPSTVSATVLDALPVGLDAITWTCVGDQGAVCGQASGSGDVNLGVTIPADGGVTVVISSTVTGDAPTGAELVNEAAVEWESEGTTRAADDSAGVNIVPAYSGPCSIFCDGFEGDDQPRPTVALAAMGETGVLTASGWARGSTATGKPSVAVELLDDSSRVVAWVDRLTVGEVQLMRLRWLDADGAQRAGAFVRWPQGSAVAYAWSMDMGGVSLVLYPSGGASEAGLRLQLPAGAAIPTGARLP